MECGPYTEATEKAQRMIAYNEFLRSIANNEYAGEYEANQMSNFLKSNMYIFNSASNNPILFVVHVEGATGNIYLGYIREEKYYVLKKT